MITNIGASSQLLGVSTDTKPINADINQIFLELDTGDLYYYTGTEWAKFAEEAEGTKSTAVTQTSNTTKVGAVREALSGDLTETEETEFEKSEFEPVSEEGEENDETENGAAEKGV